MIKRALAAATAIALAGPAAAQELTVGYIYPGSVSDVGWVKQLDLGREAIEAAYGDRVASVVVENIFAGPDAGRVVNQMVSDGVDFVMLGSFGYMNDGLRAAQRNPDVSFIHASGFRQTANFGTFTARMYEGFFLGGMAAGMVSESGVLGLIGAFPVPEIVANINAITLAARRVNPDVEVKVVFLNSWFDPPQAQEAARALISQGADVLFSINQNTPSVVTVAQDEGVYVVNTNSDMSAYGPDAVLASVTSIWDDYFVAQVGAHLDSAFEGGDERGGLRSGMVRVVAYNDDLTADQRAQLAAVEAAFVAGEDHPFTGPIVDQKGVEQVAAGAVAADDAIFGMNWLVKGVDGVLPE